MLNYSTAPTVGGDGAQRSVCPEHRAGGNNSEGLSHRVPAPCKDPALSRHPLNDSRARSRVSPKELMLSVGQESPQMQNKEHNPASHGGKTTPNRLQIIDFAESKRALNRLGSDPKADKKPPKDTGHILKYKTLILVSF